MSKFRKRTARQGKGQNWKIRWRKKIHEKHQEENASLAGQLQEAQGAELRRTWRGTEMKEILEENAGDLKLSCEVSNSEDKERGLQSSRKNQSRIKAGIRVEPDSLELLQQRPGTLTI